jgi:hypothetical protein
VPPTGEFIRRFLMHTLPDGFHRIRYYGFAANGHRAARLALCRQLLDVATRRAEAPHDECTGDSPPDTALPCPCCGGRMIIVEMFDSPHAGARFDSS